MDVAVDPDRLVVASVAPGVLADVLAGWDMEADLAPLVLALPGAVAADVALVLGQTWTGWLRGLGEAARAESALLASSGRTYAAAEATVAACVRSGTPGVRQPLAYQQGEDVSGEARQR